MVKIRITTILALVLAILFVAAALAEDEVVTSEAITDSTAMEQTTAAPTEHFVVTYFHGDVRCATCKKLEAYSHEAIVDGFGDQLKSGDVVWRTVNYDKEENKHYIDDYKLFTKAVIVSKMQDSVEVNWLNLEKIWALVGDKDEYIKYVQTETRSFMTAVPESEITEE